MSSLRRKASALAMFSSSGDGGFAAELSRAGTAAVVAMVRRCFYSSAATCGGADRSTSTSREERRIVFSRPLSSSPAADVINSVGRARLAFPASSDFTQVSPLMVVSGASVAVSILFRV